MSHAPYVGSDFDPPLSEDAELMLRFVEEKKRVIRKLEREVPHAFLGGVILGALVVDVLRGVVQMLLFHWLGP